MVRVAMVGCGGRAGVHAPVARRSGKVEIAVWYDVDHKKAEGLAVRYGGKAVKCWDDILSDDSIEGIVVALPHHLHHQFGAAAIKAGKHLMMEIPIAASVEEAEDLIALAEKAEVEFLVVHSLRFWRSHQQVKAFIERGVIGEPFFARYHNEHYVPETYFGRQKPHVDAGYLTVESGVLHHGDVLRWWMGEVRTITARGLMVEKTSRELSAFDHITVLYDFENGRLGESTCSWVSRVCDQNYMVRGSVNGTKGTIVITWNDEVRLYSEANMLPEGERFLMLQDIGAPAITSDVAGLRGPDDEIAHFADCIRYKVPPLVSPRDALRALQMALASRVSARTLKPITL